MFFLLFFDSGLVIVLYLQASQYAHILSSFSPPSLQLVCLYEGHVPAKTIVFCFVLFYLLVGAQDGDGPVAVLLVEGDELEHVVVSQTQRRVDLVEREPPRLDALLVLLPSSPPQKK